MIVPGTKKKGPEFVQSTPPANPWVGCTWYDTTNDELKVFNGVDWDTMLDMVKIDYGYVCGGNDSSNTLSIVDRFAFPFDSGTATHVGNLSSVRLAIAACASSTHGYACGGYSGNYLSIIDRFAFPFDSGTATHVGDLSGTRHTLAACASSTHGYVCGGFHYDGSNRYWFSTIDRFAFPLDTGTATNVSSLTQSKNNPGACSSTTHGYVCGGYVYDTFYSTVERFLFPLDSGGVVTHVGDLSSSRKTQSTSSSIAAYSCGGSHDDYAHYSMIDRFLFPFDSGVSTNVGNLSINRAFASTCNSSSCGYICGHASLYSTTTNSTIDRITFPFTAGTAVNVGTLSAAKGHTAACSSVDPHLRW